MAAVETGYLANGMNLYRIALTGDVIHPLAPQCSIRANTDLYQLVVIQGAFNLDKDIFTQTLFGHHDHRVELMGQSSQVPKLAIVELHCIVLIVVLRLWQTVVFRFHVRLGRRFYHAVQAADRGNMARSKSSKRWLQAHFDDPYVKQAQDEGLRSRAAFKLLQLDEKYGLLSPGLVVVDLGAAPGSWSEVTVPRIEPGGRVIALDVLPMEPLSGVEFIEGDFTETPALEALEAALGGTGVDLVLSDMAPNMSGVAVTDQAKAMYLAELAFDFACNHLKPGGHFLVKMFQGEGFDGFVPHCRKFFASVLVRKPRASRPKSREVYLLARNRLVE